MLDLDDAEEKEALRHLSEMERNIILRMKVSAADYLAVKRGEPFPQRKETGKRQSAGAYRVITALGSALGLGSAATMPDIKAECAARSQATLRTHTYSAEKTKESQDWKRLAEFVDLVSRLV